MARPKDKPPVLEKLDDENAQRGGASGTGPSPTDWKRWPRWQRALVGVLFVVIALSYVLSISLIRR